MVENIVKAVHKIYEEHPLGALILKSIEVQPGEETSEEFKRGFYAARTIIELQGAVELEGYIVTEKSPLDLRIEEMKNGGSISVQSREIDGKFQQRSVLTGPWDTVEKPSGLTDPS